MGISWSKGTKSSPPPPSSSAAATATVFFYCSALPSLSPPPPASTPPPPPPLPAVPYGSPKCKRSKNDVNIHKDTIRVQIDEFNKDFHLVSFTFDALVDGRIMTLDSNSYFSSIMRTELRDSRILSGKPDSFLVCREKSTASQDQINNFAIAVICISFPIYALLGLPCVIGLYPTVVVVRVSILRLDKSFNGKYYELSVRRPVERTTRECFEDLPITLEDKTA
ncbi:hypothetical protein HAX54_013636 [Datura stramonium]|uniref:MGRN1/RNF157-like N-terminal domain-containing protein n=1 Tax=Datura stramonium TaxID=4076 RepID=A0ABS8TLL0_DATST|nr:hypothetical protein [Datura stramonium]